MTETGSKVTSCTGKKTAQQEKAGTGDSEMSLPRTPCFPLTWVRRCERLGVNWAYRVTVGYLPWSGEVGNPPAHMVLEI